MKNVTMADIAKRAGTSAAAVSVALNGARSRTLRVSDETRERIVEAARELGYRRHPVALALATGRTRVLGLMLPYPASLYESMSSFESTLVDGIVLQVGRRGYNLMLYTATAEMEGDRAADMIDRQIDGLFLVIPPAESPIIPECERQGICTTAVLAKREQATLTVNSDDYTGGYLATCHLIELGHRRIAHLLGRAGVVTSEPRRKGYEDALHSNGIEPDDELCLPGDFTYDQGLKSTRRLLKQPIERRPTAIFASNDPSAHGAMDAIHEAGLKIPDDISVVGYDDTWYATVLRPALTSVSMDVRGLGRMAADLMISYLEGEEVVDPHPILPVSLSVRESSGPAPRGPTSP